MYGRLFTLVSIEDPREIFAWGMEITNDDRVDAVIYRPDPVTQQGMIGLHPSAGAARRRYSRIHPLQIIWEAQLLQDEVAEFIELRQGGGQGEAEDPEPPQP